MENKTKVKAEEGQQELWLTREFDLPLELLFKAYVEPKIVEQWMDTKIIKFNCQKHGAFQFETTAPKGGKLRFNGVIHELKPNSKIIRTFEMENMPFGVQLEVLEFIKLTDDTSKLKKQVIYQSVAHRDENLKLPFSYGINMAHDRLEEVLSKLK